ncbi:MAG: transporter substrate-binding domain-containing protein [Oligoflexales bacterium]|nr:transporter substrate-binding domain-containing protein [Oligoflexales bacterium]
MICRIIAVITFFLCSVAYALDFQVYTEQFPPYNFTEGNKVTGVSTEIVETVLKTAGFTYEIKVITWPKALETVKTTPGTLLYSTGRSKEREPLFKWVGPIVPKTNSVFALTSRSDIKVEKLDDLKKYKIGTTKDDFREQYLITKGFKLNEHLFSVGGAEPNSWNLKKLISSNIDLWPMPDAVAHYLLKKENIDAKTIRRVIYLDEINGDGYFIAVNKSVPDETVAKLKDSLDSLKKKGVLQDIWKKYGL